MQGRTGDWRTALSVFDDMQQAGHRPRLTSYTVAISACARAGEWRCELCSLPNPPALKPLSLDRTPPGGRSRIGYSASQSRHSSALHYSRCRRMICACAVRAVIFLRKTGAAAARRAQGEWAAARHPRVQRRAQCRQRQLAAPDGHRRHARQGRRARAVGPSGSARCGASGGDARWRRARGRGHLQHRYGGVRGGYTRCQLSAPRLLPSPSVSTKSTIT